MAKVVTVQGANGEDETLRHKALEQLNNLSTIELERLSQISKSDKARKYFKNDILFATVKGFLK